MEITAYDLQIVQELSLINYGKLYQKLTETQKRKVIDEFTNGNYREVILDNERWRGPVLIFDNNKQ